MTNARIHFLSGFPRSGSTLLAAILNQHPQIHGSSTSPLIDIMGAIAKTWEESPSVLAQGRGIDEVLPFLRAAIQINYADCKKSTVIDKSRGWPHPRIMATMEKVIGEKPRIIATVRALPDCAASFVRIAKPADIKLFLRGSALIQHLKESYLTLQAGFAAAPENFHFVDYEDLIDNPQATMAGVLAFLGIEPFAFDLLAIRGDVVSERDEAAWGVPGLHDVKPVLGRQHVENAQDVLGDLYSTFIQPKFWKTTEEPIAPAVIDLQKDANIRGDFAKGWELAQMLEIASPSDDRAAYNRGWHILHRGDLQTGIELLDRGRNDGAFGTGVATGAPLWDGLRKETVLLNLEAGLGDQIHGVRFAQAIAARGCRVIVAGNPRLAPLLKNVKGVSAFVQSGGGNAVYHDSWVPSMSAVRPLGLTWKTIDGRPYLGCYSPPKSHRPRIGLRWLGNTKIEENTYRTFPHEDFFAAVRHPSCDYVSLQRDEGAEYCPDWCDEADLSTWENTAATISTCDIVITSCTSVSHLAGAMGVPTWTILPVMPYYLYALPGNKTPWYRSMRLFRQEIFGDWNAPLMAIKNQIRAGIKS